MCCEVGYKGFRKSLLPFLAADTKSNSSAATMTDSYAVMGNPIGHSLSPAIHAQFAEQLGEHLTYEAILVELDGFSQAVHDFHARGGRGLSVTVPFKETAWSLALRRCPRAEIAGAANTLWFDENGVIIADNTDGVGLTTDLMRALDVEIRGARVLMLGAGGAARGALGALLEEAPAHLVIANRTPAKAHTLADLIGGHDEVVGCGYDELGSFEFDIIINATSASLAGEVPRIPVGTLSRSVCCYDMMYGATPTVFLTWARQNGATRLSDGLGMLVEQAAQAFYLWRGVRPQTLPVLSQLRHRIGN